MVKNAIWFIVVTAVEVSGKEVRSLFKPATIRDIFCYQLRALNPAFFANVIELRTESHDTLLGFKMLKASRG